MIDTILSFSLAHFQLFILGLLAFVLLVGIVCIVVMSLMLVGMRRALGELTKARLEIRSHAPMHAAHRVPYEERLKAEYEKRGLKWEDKPGGK